MPLSKDILKKIRRIHIKTNFMATEIFSGEYESAFKGTGMSFEEVREYVPGDDVRLIDWNVTARTGRPHLKVFRQERERSLILLVDMSASMRFGGAAGSKRDLAAEVAAVLAYAAIKSNDKVGLLLYTETVERFIPPKKGRGHIWRLIEEILTYEPVHRKTRIAVAARFLLHTVKRRAICIVISDFMEPAALQPLKILKGRHDVVCLPVADHLEKTWPDLGLLPVADMESGQWQWIDTANRAWRRASAAAYERRHADFVTTLQSYGMDVAPLTVGDAYLAPLVALFRRREKSGRGGR